MERVFEFLQNHPLLVGSFFVFLTLFFLLESRRSGKKISPQQVGQLTNQGATVIDLREPKDYNDGHISGSRNIPYSRLKDSLDELKNMSNPIIIVCKMGTSASAAVQQIGTNNIYRLDGGIMNWKAQGLPLIQSKSAQNKSGNKKNKKKRA